MKNLLFGGLIILVLAGFLIFTNVSEKKEVKGVSSSLKKIQKEVSQETTKQETKKYTLSDVAKHDNENDCWMAIEGKVYDVTKMIPQHPGGLVILNGCGKDATSLFNQRGGKGPHSEAARKLLSNFLIGDLSLK